MSNSTSTPDSTPKSKTAQSKSNTSTSTNSTGSSSNSSSSSTALVSGSGSLQRTDLLNQYLAEVRKYPLLNPEEERELAIKYIEEGDEEAGRTLITSNLRLVVKMAFKFHNQWANVLDLIQQGNMGLLQALNKYDPYNEANTRFSSYAAYWIRSCIYTYIKDNYRMVRLGSTRHGRRLFDNLRKERERLIRQGVQPSTKALSESLEIPEEEIVVFSQHFSAPALSLNSPIGEDDGRTLEEMVNGSGTTTPETVSADTEIGTMVKNVLDEFVLTLDNPRDLSIWHERMMNDSPKSLKELGDRYGVSKERIRQIENRIKKNLKVALVENLGDNIDFDFLIPEEE
ncbi:MAG: sigma-70 family RNA polymerase sigma factor [Myxococcota bacterium]